MHSRRSLPSLGLRAAALAAGALLLVATLAGVASAEPGKTPVLVITDFPVRASLIPDDTFWADQWGLRSVQADLAWNVETGSRSVFVAVVDTGVWWTHNDILANMWSNTDGTHGYDFIDSDTNPMDEDTAGGTFHGTGVAGVVAALLDNGYQIAGAAQVGVMALRALGPNGEGSSYNTSRAIRWAADRGAKIINLSLGTNDTFSGPTDMQLAIDYAWGRGALVVAAAGNAGVNRLDYPARLPNVVSVAALEEGGSRAGYSNYGAGLDISAPGSRILTLTANHQIHYLYGTSLAAPYVSAAAALLWSYEPALTNVDVWNILNRTAEDKGSPGPDTGYGWGEVDYWGAINALNRPFISVNNVPNQVARSAEFTVGWSILGPSGLPISDTHLVWGTSPGGLGNATPAQTGATKANFTAGGLRMPEGASAFYFKVVATVNGTPYESEVRSVTVTSLPDFLFVLYNLFASNLLYLALFILALAAIVAFVPSRRRRARRAVYHPRVGYPYAYRPVMPPPAAPPPAVPRAAPPPYVAPAPPPVPPPVVPAAAPASPPPTSGPPPAAAGPTKKRCPNCGMTVNADNLFCFFCGHAFR